MVPFKETSKVFFNIHWAEQTRPNIIVALTREVINDDFKSYDNENFYPFQLLQFSLDQLISKALGVQLHTLL